MRLYSKGAREAATGPSQVHGPSPSVIITTEMAVIPISSNCLTQTKAETKRSAVKPVRYNTSSSSANKHPGALSLMKAIISEGQDGSVHSQRRPPVPKFDACVDNATKEAGTFTKPSECARVTQSDVFVAAAATCEKITGT